MWYCRILCVVFIFISDNNKLVYIERTLLTGADAWTPSATYKGNAGNISTRLLFSNQSAENKIINVGSA